MEKLKILAIQWSDDTYYNIHIVSNGNAVYITYNILKWTLKEKRKQINFMCDTHNFYYRSWQKWFDLNDYDFIRPKIKFIKFDK